MAIAIFTSWTTYGTWLPGDERGWYRHRMGLLAPDSTLKDVMRRELNESAVILDHEQRAIVESTIRENCAFRGWILHALNCRSNHVHVAVTAPSIRQIREPRLTFKAWCTKRLRERVPSRKSWWTECGWDVWIDKEDHLRNVVRYIMEGQ